MGFGIISPENGFNIGRLERKKTLTHLHHQHHRTLPLLTIMNVQQLVTDSTSQHAEICLQTH